MAQLLQSRLTLRWQLRRLRQLPAHERWAKYREVAQRVLRHGPIVLWPRVYFDERGAIDIMCRYQQPGHDVPMHLFVAEGSAADLGADLLGWDDFHRGPITVHRCPGNHVTLLDQPEVQHVARMMLESLHQA